MAGEPSTANALMRAALSYAERCWPVFPLHSVSDGRCTCSKANCSSPGKHPRTEHGFREASTEAALITRWWATWPDANVGIAMGGPARLAALDIDGPAGEASLQELVRQHGELPATLESRTGNGRHLLFAFPEGLTIGPSVGKLGDGIDIRGQGSYIVAPPSLHARGRLYQWECERPIACWPEWLTRILDTPRPRSHSEDDDEGKIPEGRRNDALTSLAGKLRWSGLKQPEMLAALDVVNKLRCEPPLADAEVSRVAASVASYPPGDRGSTAGQRESAATRLIQIAEAMELFHDAMGDAYASVPVNGHRETVRIDSRAFRRRLSLEFYAAEGKAPSPQAAASALPTIEAKALFGEIQHEAHVRVADHEGEIYLDLCNRDWEAVRITTTGWTVVHDPPVRFVRREGMLPLPSPASGGSLHVLRTFLNVDDADWPLVVGYLLGCLRERGPFPPLALIGEQGSGKTTASRLLKGVIDPSEAAVRCAPKDERDLMIAAQGAHVLALDNLSHLDEQLSDALCRLATGSGLATRTLYTDRDETIFRAARPVIVNSIGEVVSRSDLLDRAIVLSVPPLAAGERRPESEYWDGFRVVHAGILGCLCDAASLALRQTRRPVSAPDVRMLDFALFVIRGEEALGLEPGSFAKAYESNRKAANEAVVELSPVAQAVERFAADKGQWDGSVTELLELLTPRVSVESARSREWPKTARGLSSALRRIVPNLRRVGIKVAFLGRTPRSGRSRVSVEKVPGEYSPRSPDQDLHPTLTLEPGDRPRDKVPVNVVNVGEDSSELVSVAGAEVKVEEGDV
jgi:hypothetical protein